MSLYLIRHADAGGRQRGPADRERALTALGQSQAAALVQMLANEQIDTIFSSPATRCIQTVEPLAESRGLATEIRDELWEGRAASDLAATLRRLAGAGLDAVLCTHGDLIPAVLTELGNAGVPLAGTGCAKGSVWTLRTADGAIAEGRYRAGPAARAVPIDTAASGDGR